MARRSGRARWAVAGAMAAALLAGGCAETRVARLGPLGATERLLTVVVTSDRRFVQQECAGALALGRVYGCQRLEAVTLPDGRPARAVKIVRFADHVPSSVAFDIEARGLCHAVASVQAIPDPCDGG